MGIRASNPKPFGKRPAPPPGPPPASDVFSRTATTGTTGATIGEYRYRNTDIGVPPPPGESIGGGSGEAGNASDGGLKKTGGSGEAGNASDGGMKKTGGSGEAGNASDGGLKKTGGSGEMSATSQAIAPECAARSLPAVTPHPSVAGQAMEHRASPRTDGQVDACTENDQQWFGTMAQNIVEGRWRYRVLGGMRLLERWWRKIK